MSPHGRPRGEYRRAQPEGAPVTAVLTRRALLGGAGLVVAFAAGCTLPVIPKRPAPDLGSALGWVRHDGDGRFTLFVPRAEMGQQVATALKQIACDELGIAWDRLDARLPSTRDIGRVRATVGSESIRDFALPLAQACAALREALAAGTAPQARERPVSELRSLQRGGRPVGAHVPQEQAGAIVRGQPLYAADVRRPGQLHGRVLRAPASPELPSRLLAIDEAAGRAVPGFVALVHDARLALMQSEGLGLVAQTPAALDRIEQALAPRWHVVGDFGQAEVEALIDIRRREAVSARRAKAVCDDRVDDDAPWDIDLQLDLPPAAHNAIEPRAAVAEPRADGGLEVWAGSQDAFHVRDVIAKRLGLDEASVIVHARRCGGAFGGRTLCTVELEAAVLARAAAAPVKLQWTRAQELHQGFARPPSSHRIRARLRGGRLHDWWHTFASSHILFTNAGFPPWLQRLADVLPDAGVARGADMPYRAAARRIEFDQQRIPLLTGPWRGLGAGPNGFAIESAIDECARHAGADPLDFRLAHVADERLAGVLRCAGDAAGWSQAMTSRKRGRGLGFGLACGIYKAASYAAVVAEVAVDRSSGVVRVQRLVCAHDCGLVINPDGVRAQCEGNLVWGLSMLLFDDLPAAHSRVAATNFGDAPIPRLADVPVLQVELVQSQAPPAGAGETAIVAAAAAIANAVRDACGHRVQRLPLRAVTLRAALAAAS